MKSLQESKREPEIKKSILEEDVDSLREERAKPKAAERVSGVNAKEKQMADQLKGALENQMDQPRDSHMKQFSARRNEISEKQECSQVNDENRLVRFLEDTVAKKPHQEVEDLLPREQPGTAGQSAPAARSGQYRSALQNCLTSSDIDMM